jgi:NitT/TauT family transport system substrate-binding protein
MKLTTRTCAAVLACFVIGSARAEVSEIKVAQQYAASFLPLMIMEREKLVEKHAKSLGLPELKVSWVQFAGPSVLNDGVISGAIQFIAVGPPSLITLWDKTRSSVQVKGVGAVATYPLYLNVRNPALKTIADLSDKDKIALTSIKVSAQAVLLQMEAARLYGDANYTKFDAYTVGMSNPDGMLAFINSNAGVDAHFTTSPFSEQELKVPGARTLTTSYQILGGPATALSVATTTRFRDENPKTYKAFYEALAEAIAIVNKDKRAAAKAYLEQTKDTKNTVDDIYAMISAKDYIFTLTPQKFGKTADFMHRIGTIKNKPASWKDLFFPEVQGLPGD